MTQITLEFSNDNELSRLLELLRQFDVRIIQNSPNGRKKRQSVAEFYGQFNLRVSDFALNRDEANER